MIEVNNVTKSFGEKTVLQNVNLTIYDGERIGIIGDNGQGKTTLLKLINSQIRPDEGFVKVSNSIGYLPQSCDLNFESMLVEISDHEFAKRFFKYARILNLKDCLFEERGFAGLSGGEKTKIALASIFAKDVSTIILDEPTNHIDYSAKKDIINAINSFDGTVIVVSHDVEFLNEVVTKIVKVKEGNLEEYYGNYDDYIEQSRTINANIQREYESQNRRIEKLQKDISRYKGWAESADKNVGKQGGNPSDSRLAAVKQNASNSAKKLSGVVKSKESALAQELNNRVQSPDKQINIKYRLSKENLKAKTALSFIDVDFSYGDNKLFYGVNFTIMSGEKIALVGDNGCGKTTLIKLITGKEEPSSGIVRLTPSLKIGIMSQDVYDLPSDATIFDLAKSYDKDYAHIFLSNLVNMNIDKTRFNTKIKNLSSGEQMRIKLSELILSDANMLILDEPTNHLDIANKNYLKKVLVDYVGTLMIVSHDKEFLKDIAQYELIFENYTVKKKELISEDVF